MVLCWLLMTLASALAQICSLEMQGNGVCDHGCMTNVYAFDSRGDSVSDCEMDCLTHCPIGKLGNFQCDVECGTWDCAWDSGDCLLCSESCLVASLGNGVCDPECDSWSCGWDYGDCSGSDNPVHIYVGTGADQGNGSLETPFNDFTETLMKLFLPYNDVNLLEGTHYLNPNSIDEPVLLSQSGLVETHIRGLCITAKCEFTMIQLTPNFASFRLSHSVRFSNIHFLGGFSLRPGCLAATCQYCPYTVFNSATGQWRNDRNEVIDISEYATQNFCDEYHKKVFISVTEGTELEIDSVVFEGFRQQLNALILNESGKVTLRNVSFTRSMSDPTKLNGGLLQNYCPASLLPYYCGSVLFTSGSVSLLNDGYEYRSDQVLSGFLSLQGVHFLLIRNVTFAYNFVMFGLAVNDEVLNHASLVFVNGFRQIQVDNCTFDTNIAESSAALFLKSHIHFPLIPVNGVSSEHLLLHLSISTSHFLNNTSQTQSLIHIEIAGDLININIEQTKFEGNFGDLGLISIENASFYAEAAVDEIKEIAGQSVLLPSRTIVITDWNGTDNYGTQMVKLVNTANLIVVRSEFNGCGEKREGLSLYRDAVRSFVEAEDTYAQVLPAISASLSCSSIMTVLNSYNFSFTDSSLHNTYCPTGFSGLSLQGLVTALDLHRVIFENNRGTAALEIAVGSPVGIAMSNLSFRNNSNLFNRNPACVSIRLSTPTDIQISNSSFTSNYGWSNTVLYVSNIQNLTLSHISLWNNTALFSCSGVVFTPHPSLPCQLLITDSEFTNNRAMSYGVISVMDSDGLLAGNSATVVDIRIINSEFRENKSGYEGAGVTLTNFIDISQGSTVANCSFIENESQQGAAIFLSFESGFFTVENCTFRSNAASEGAAMYLHQFPAFDVRTGVRVSHCVFLSQVYGAAISIEGYDTPNTVETDHNLFDRGSGAVAVTKGVMNDRDSQYLYQERMTGAAINVGMYSIVTVRNMTATGNRASNKGGVFFATETSTLTIFDSVFSRNIASDCGGVIYSDGDSYIAIQDSYLSQNSAGSVGSVVFVSPGRLSVKNCSITQNFANSYAVVFLTRCAAEIDTVRFRNNTSMKDSPGIVVSSCNLTINNSVFADQQANTGAFILSIDHNLVVINNSSFQRGVSFTQGGAIFGTLQSEFHIFGSLFEDCYSGNEGGALQMSGCSLYITNSSFLRTQALINGGTLYIREGYMFVSYSLFSGFSPGALLIAGVNRIDIQGNRFENGRNDVGGAIELKNVATSFFLNNTFYNNTAESAGAVYLSSDGTSGTPDRHFFLSNQFLNNTASKGSAGVLSTLNVDVFMAGNRFVGNRAVGKDANGGAIVTACLFFDWCNVTVRGNRFEENHADSQGGGVFWQDSFPSISDNEFLNNTATYGTEVASFPVQLATVSILHTQEEYLGEYKGLPLALQLKGVASGQPLLEVISFGLFDHNKQLLTTDDRSSAKITPWNSSEVTMYGELDTKAVSGVFSFTGFTMVGKPGTTQYMLITTNGIDPTNKATMRDPTDYYPILLIEAMFRMCRSGESLQNKECYLCAAGTYSLDPALPCLLCPSAAVCYGNNTMVPKPGYWRIRNDTDMFIECLAPEACIGSPDSPFLSETGLCALGYTGNLCQQCIEGYSRTGRFQCSICPSKASNIAVTTLIVILALILVALIVWTAIKSAMKPQSLIAIYAKIFMNYLQMVVVSAALNLNWPTFAKTFLNGQQMAGGLAEQLFSIECLFQDASTLNSHTYFTKLQLYAGLPVLMFVLATLAWGILSLCQHIEHKFLKIVASIVIILFILHPSITKIMFSLFACMDLGDGQLWLINDLSIICWNTDHLRQVLIVAVPSMLVFVFGLPILCLLYLVCRRQKLDTPNMKLMLCFLYKGYHRQRFYWEFVILYRKVAMIAASVFLAPVSIRVQSLTVLALLLFSLFLQVQINPFFDLSLNRLEVKAILVSAITIYSGLYYDTNDLNSSIKISLFVLMILSNVYFLYSWIRLVSPVLLHTLLERFSTLFRWRKNYKIQAMNSISPSLPEKPNSSIFASDITNPHYSASDVPPPNLEASNMSSYNDPANTSIAMQREYTEHEEAKEQVHYTLVE